MFWVSSNLQENLWCSFEYFISLSFVSFLIEKQTKKINKKIGVFFFFFYCSYLSNVFFEAFVYSSFVNLIVGTWKDILGIVIME